MFSFFFFCRIFQYCFVSYSIEWWAWTQEALSTREVGPESTPLWTDTQRLEALARQSWDLETRMEGRESDFIAQQERALSAEAWTWDIPLESPQWGGWTPEVSAEASPDVNPETILESVPPSEAERLAAEAAVIAAGWDIADTDAINAAIIAQRWDVVGEARELTDAEQEIVREWLLAEYAAEIGIEPELLTSLYAFNSENNPEFNPDSIWQDMADFANQMERLSILVWRTQWLEMPTNQEEFNALMQRFRGEDWRIHIPLTEEEMVEMWITVDEDGNITISDGTTYSGVQDVPPGRPYVSGGTVNSWYSGSARYEGWGNYWYESSIDVNNLPRGVEGLMDYIVHEEAGGSYDRLYNQCRIQPPRPITQMTVWEVRQFQNEMVRDQNRRGINPASSAVWGLQIIRGTLDGLVSAWVVNSGDTFNRETQQRLMLALLTEDGLDRYRSRQISKWDFMRNIAGTWASFPADATGRWVYDGDAIWNRAYADAGVVSRLLDEILEDASWNPSWSAIS